MDELKKRLDKYKYPLLVLIIGAALMLLPSGGSSTEATADEKIALLLESVEGVGELKVVISENGVVVACEGADSAKVRMDITNAIVSYTGFGSGKITILKMADAN